MTKLRVLHLEDNPADAELILIELKRSGFTVTSTRVDNREDFVAALSPDLDLILADYNLPQFDAVSALQVINKAGLDLPFIIVSGGIAEDVAVAAIHMGAADYLLKDRLTRLAPAIHRALEQKEMRAEQRRTADRLVESEARFRRVFEEGAVGMALVAPDYSFIKVNDAFCQMLGYSQDELVSMTVQSVTHPDDYEVAAELARQAFQGSMPNYRVERYLKKTGEEVWVQVSSSVMSAGGGNQPYMIGVIIDITERRRIEQELQFLALHDALTGLANRTLFTDRLEHAIQAARRDGTSFGLMVMDMDRFKEVNDSMGHASGDLLLKQVASRLRGSLREVDTVARLGETNSASCPRAEEASKGRSVPPRSSSRRWTFPSTSAKPLSMSACQLESRNFPNTARTRRRWCAGQMLRCMSPSATGLGTPFTPPSRMNTPPTAWP